MPFEESVIYSVDDEAWTAPFWDMCEFDNAFPGVVYDGTDSLDLAMGFAKQHVGESVVFVVDSRMPLELSKWRVVKEYLSARYHCDLDRYSDEGAIKGMLVGAWIKGQSERTFRVILLTAFARELNDLLRDKDLRRIADGGIDQIVAKSNEKTLRTVVHDKLKEINRRDDS